MAEVLVNLNNSDMKNRRLARYDCAKMNLAPTINVYSIEKKIEESQEFMVQMIDEYEYKVGKLEKFVEILDNREKLIGNSRQTHEEKSSNECLKYKNLF